MTAADIIQWYEAVAVRFRQCGLPPVRGGFLGFRTESGLAIHVETLTIDHTNHTTLATRQHFRFRILQTKHIHQRLRHRRMEFFTVIVPRSNQGAILFLVGYDFADQPVHFVADVARGTQIYDLRHVGLLPQAA